MQVATASSIPTETTDYAGPHKFQTHWYAKLIRKIMRHKEYTRWTNECCEPLTVDGSEVLDGFAGPAIFIANHQSHMDTPVIMSSLPNSIKDNIFFGAAADRWFVKGKKKLILQPWYQSLVLGNFPIVRGGGSRTLDYAKHLLDSGSNVCIFPEGTRAMSDELGEFRHGVAMLAKAANVPVVPVVLQGLRELRPKGSRTITPGPVRVTILEPVCLPLEMGVVESTNLLRQKMETILKEWRMATLSDKPILSVHSNEDRVDEKKELTRAA